MPQRVLKKPCARKTQARKRRGQADPLLGNNWRAWCQHTLSVGPTWVHVACQLAHLLCSRISEILALKASDFDFAAKKVTIKAMKRHLEVKKPMSNAAFKVLTSLREEGCSERRSRAWGSRGLVTYTDAWKWPSEAEMVDGEGGQELDGKCGGYLFPATRSDSRLPYRTKASNN